jgi:hypothetical protein
MPGHRPATLFSRLRWQFRPFAVVVDALIHGRLASASNGLLDTFQDVGLIASFFSACLDDRRCAVAAQMFTNSYEGRHGRRNIPAQWSTGLTAKEVLEIKFSIMRRRFVQEVRKNDVTMRRVRS